MAVLDVQPFRVDVPDADLLDLRNRIEHTRWPDEIEHAGWDYGIPRDYLEQIAAYWQRDYDWRSTEETINSYANYRARIDGIAVHFIHIRGTGPDPLPLLITHGWPSTFFEMLDLASQLADPAHYGADPSDSFNVVVPSIPGYAFSEKPRRRGFTYARVAEIWVQLMEALGYHRFGTHAYDIGASVTGIMLRRVPDRVIGYHTTEPTNPGPYLGPGTAPLSSDERAYQQVQHAWQTDQSGYMAMQTTKPQTLGYGLNDSPIGTAAWILDKWHDWTVEPGQPLERSFTVDQLLATVSIYWLTETLNSANRLYYERAHAPTPMQPGEFIDVPLGVARTTQPIERAPREYVERVFSDIRHWIDLERGGHFAALEEPTAVAESIRTFFRPLRD